MPSLHTPPSSIFAVGIALALIFVLILPLTFIAAMIGGREVQ